eukprot:3926960-Pleurochrysis_carterae.AAC.2
MPCARRRRQRRPLAAPRASLQARRTFRAERRSAALRMLHETPLNTSPRAVDLLCAQSSLRARGTRPAPRRALPESRPSPPTACEAVSGNAGSPPAARGAQLARHGIRPEPTLENQKETLSHAAGRRCVSYFEALWRAVDQHSARASQMGARLKLIRSRTWHGRRCQNQTITASVHGCVVWNSPEQI